MDRFIEYRVHKKLNIEPSIKVIITRRRKNKKPKESEYENLEVELFATSGLAYDKTIVFLAKTKDNNRIPVNEKNII